MILPTKHIPLNQSMIGLGALLLKKLDRPRTVSGLWRKIRFIPEVGTFQRFVIVLDFLYALGLIQFRNGLLNRRAV